MYGIYLHLGVNPMLEHGKCRYLPNTWMPWVIFKAHGWSLNFVGFSMWWEQILLQSQQVPICAESKQAIRKVSDRFFWDGEIV